ncbi:hypothetical protein BJ170DRAFT_79377 [Xylariales sp. AK1849]|nr:hypothetical protein BJ170DRAFT_79377 [Xylariales sp. AK1849]
MSMAETAMPREVDIKKIEIPEKTISQSSHEESPDSYATHSTYDTDLLDELAGVDEDCLLAEASIMDTRESKQRGEMVEPPALPQKSSLRASRLLKSLKLNSIESATQALTTPHDLYLSSEEDASSSADDFSDYDYDYDYESIRAESEKSEKSHVRRKSYEDTARVVSVVFSGKPCIVDLPSHRRSISTASDSSAALKLLPPRTSSLASTPLATPQPSFLDQDPFEGSNHTLEGAKEARLDGTASRTPKTPTAVLNRVQRTFSLVRKRSRPILRTSNLVGLSKDNLASRASSSTLNLSHLITTSSGQPRVVESPVEDIESPRSPVSYSDIMRAARRNSTTKNNSVTTLPQIPSASPVIPIAVKMGLLKGFHRRRNIKP